MSVILHNEEKYQMVYQTLKQYQIPNGLTSCNMVTSLILRSFDIHPFKNPEDFDYKIRVFCDELYRANQLAYERQYGENHGHIQIEPLNLISKQPFKNKCQLLKTLSSIRYNIYDNNGEVSNFESTIKQLEKLINTLKDIIIDELPEYQQADWA